MVKPGGRRAKQWEINKMKERIIVIGNNKRNPSN
jgi:hypothetical protein